MTTIEQALRELIRLQDIKEGMEKLEPGTGAWLQHNGEYSSMQQAAWINARAALSAAPAEPVGMEAIEGALAQLVDASVRHGIISERALEDEQYKGPVQEHFFNDKAAKRNALLSLIRNAIGHDAKDGERWDGSADKTHELKTDPAVFQAVWSGEKTFEIRKADRPFAVGDALYLRETKYTGEQMRHCAPLEYTGRTVRVRVSHILRGPLYGLEQGWCILSFDAALNAAEEGKTK